MDQARRARRASSCARLHTRNHRADRVEITKQEAWIKREGLDGRLHVPDFIRETIEQIAFEARDDQRIDKRSGVSQRLPSSVMQSAVSNAERRALLTEEDEVVPRISDIYAAAPSMTGKMEL